MVEPVRWGILGTARFALEHMGPAIHAARGAELAAIAARRAEDRLGSVGRWRWKTTSRLFAY